MRRNRKPLEPPPLPLPASEDEQKEIFAGWPEILRNMFVITIRPTRLRAFERRMGKLCEFLTVVKGVDGNLLNIAQLQKQRIYKPLNKWNTLTRGELGCFLSHRAIWQRVVDADLPYALIMEDDCLLFPTVDLLKQTQQCTQEMIQGNPTWNIMLLSRGPKVAKTLKKVSAHLVKPGKSWGLHCYAISQIGAQELLKKSLPISLAVDIYVSTVAIRGRYACAPVICGVEKKLSDTMGIK
jgi:GR25 family glycosyltransferase involved in LPS biosynthesis